MCMHRSRLLDEGATTMGGQQAVPALTVDDDGEDNGPQFLWAVTRQR